MSKIVDIQIKRLQKLLDDRKITLTLDPLADSWLANEGYDPGLRCTSRSRGSFSGTCRTPLAELLLEGRIHDGESITISANGDGLLINGTTTAEGGRCQSLSRPVGRTVFDLHFEREGSGLPVFLRDTRGKTRHGRP
jgi:hypothetical protein